MQHPSRYCGAGWPARPAEWVTYTLVNRRPEFQWIRTGCGALFHDVMHYLVDWHWMVPDLCNEGCGRRQKDRHCRGCCAASVDEPANENGTGSVTLIHQVVSMVHRPLTKVWKRATRPSGSGTCHRHHRRRRTNCRCHCAESRG